MFYEKKLLWVQWRKNSFIMNFIINAFPQKLGVQLLNVMNGSALLFVQGGDRNHQHSSWPKTQSAHVQKTLSDRVKVLGFRLI